MIIEQMYTDCLAEAAYYIESNGEAAIIDPLRETQPYMDRLAQSGAKLKYVFETHFHADFVSGHIDLAKESGATIVFGPNAHTNYDVHVATDNEEFKVGDITIRVLHTPGHTMESSSFLLLDAEGNEHCVFTGDTLFIGDVGRPDLAIKSDLTKEDLAGLLFDSLRNKIMTLPDNIIVYPAHGAGSACGKNMSSETFDSLGHQKEVNYALRADMTKEEFIKEVTEGILPPPQYFPKNAMLNKLGYDSVHFVMEQGVKALSLEAFDQEVEAGALILDTRLKDEFSEGFIPDSVFVGLEGNFASWVGTVVPDIAQRIVLVTDNAQKAEEAVKRLARVGYDYAVGYLEGGFEAWKNAGRKVNTVNGITSEAFAEMHSGAIKVADVRKPTEWEAEHVEGSVNFPLNFINDNMFDLDREETWYVHCKSGYRSLIATSLMMKNGYKNVIDIKGGFDAIATTGVACTEYVCPSTQK